MKHVYPLILCLTAPLFAAADDRPQNQTSAFRKPHVPRLTLPTKQNQNTLGDVEATPVMQLLLVLAEEDEKFKEFLVKRLEETTQKTASTKQHPRRRKKSRTKKDHNNATLAHNASEDASVQKIKSKQSTKRNKRKKALK